MGNTNLLPDTHHNSLNLWNCFLIDYLGKFLFSYLLWNLRNNSAEKPKTGSVSLPFPSLLWDLLRRNTCWGVERQGTLLWCSSARDKPRRIWDKSEQSSHVHPKVSQCCSTPNSRHSPELLPLLPRPSSSPSPLSWWLPVENCCSRRGAKSSQDTRTQHRTDLQVLQLWSSDFYIFEYLKQPLRFVLTVLAHTFPSQEFPRCGEFPRIACKLY